MKNDLNSHGLIQNLSHKLKGRENPQKSEQRVMETTIKKFDAVDRKLLVRLSKIVSMVTRFVRKLRMDVIFEKCGIRLDPPAFLVIYRNGEKLKRKVMPLRNFKPFSDVEFIANDLRERHGLEGVPVVKIEKLLRLIQERLNGLDETEALEKLDKEYQIKVNEDLNKLSTHELEIQKKLMDSLFLKNQIKKGDGDFVYDKVVDFSGEKEKSNWDDSDNNFWD